MVPSVSLYSWGPSWGYVDGDERPDLFVHHHYGHRAHALEDLLLLNRASGFEPAPRPELRLRWPDTRDQHAAVFAPWSTSEPRALDCWVSVGGLQGDASQRDRIEHQLLANEGGRLVNRATETEVQAALRAGPLLRGRVAHPLDVDRDGRLDLLLLGEGAPPRLLLREGAFFRDRSSRWGLDPIQPGRQEGWRAAVADVDGDGREDLALAVGGRSRLAVYRNDGRRFVPLPSLDSERPIAGIGSVLALAAGADRRADLVLVPARAGREDALRLVRSVDGGRLEVDLIPVPVLRGRGVHANAGDLDNDGDDDLLVVTRRDVLVLENRGADGFVDVTASSGLGSLANQDQPGLLGCVSLADYDLDGRLDLAVIRGWRGPGEVSNEPGPLLLLRNVSAAGSWLRLRLVGAVNPSGIGALVTVVAGGDRRYVSVTAGVVGTCQNDPVLHLGLGDAAAAEISVAWPSGLSTVHGRLAANRLHVLSEDGAPSTER